MFFCFDYNFYARFTGNSAFCSNFIEQIIVFCQKNIERICLFWMRIIGFFVDLLKKTFCF